MSSKSLFVRNVYPTTQEELRQQNPKIRNVNLFTSNESQRLKEFINLNLIKFYDKVPLIEEGDYVTCCEVEESLAAGTKLKNLKKGSGWIENHTFMVKDTLIAQELFACFGDSGYVLLPGLRFATEEEIQKVKQNEQGRN